MSQRFVLLRHQCPEVFSKPSHWDFMLESEGTLLTWQLDELPASWAKVLGTEASGLSDAVVTKRLADHRLEYLDYQGPVPGNRGHVIRVACGEFSWQEKAENRLIVRLEGDLASGVVLSVLAGPDWALSLTST